jgi:hypothetical protein
VAVVQRTFRSLVVVVVGSVGIGLPRQAPLLVLPNFILVMQHSSSVASGTPVVFVLSSVQQIDS